jgi:AcrR family transcriptional regulator
VAAGLELFAERGFERTTVDQIAAAAGISRRTFFRYFADKEELFFAEDERLLQVVEDTLDGAPPGEPVLDLARRATGPWPRTARPTRSGAWPASG